MRLFKPVAGIFILILLLIVLISISHKEGGLKSGAMQSIAPAIAELREENDKLSRRLEELTACSSDLWGTVRQAEPGWTYEQLVGSTVIIRDRDNHGWGSGVFINDNVVLTAKHVMDNGPGLIVEYQDKIYEILKVYTDTDSDLCMILTEEIDELWIPHMMDYHDIKLGTTVQAVGSPWNSVWKLNLTEGIISHTDRSITNEFGWDILFSYDAHGAPGCSGGPVFIDGKLAGIFVAFYSLGGGNMNLAVPVSELN